MYFTLKTSYFQFLSTLRTSKLLVKRAKIYQFKKLTMIQKALFMAFVMVISNLKSSRWFKIYSRKTPEKGLKGSLLPVLKVKIVKIQKTIGHLGTSFLDLLVVVFIIKKILLVEKILMKNYEKYILRSQSQLPAYNKMPRIILRKKYSFFI